jgi:acetylglutamate kinase
VSITRPDELAKELFTHRGSGTLVRRGERVLCFDGWEGLDLDKLKELVESGFGRQLAPDYFEKVHPHRVFVSEHYRAALIITLEEGIPHLDKFAVSEDAQGEGLGRAAWQVMRANVTRLFWRARWDNPVNDFYFDESDGCVKGEKWNVFWYGLETFHEISFAVDHCRARPASLKDKA